MAELLEGSGVFETETRLAARESASTCTTAKSSFVVRAVIQDDDGMKLRVDVVGLGLTALIDPRQVVE